jgi:VirB8 protein
LLSGSGEQARFAAWYRGSNPESPQVVQGRFGVATVRIKAISLLADNVASVRFMKESRKGEETRVTHWVSTLTFSLPTRQCPPPTVSSIPSASWSRNIAPIRRSCHETFRPLDDIGLGIRGAGAGAATAGTGST